jgi:hypothetical protein
MSKSKESPPKFMVGTHTYSVAHLKVGDTHTVSRSLDPIPRGLSAAALIDDQRRKLVHSATALFVRIREKLPDHTYSATTGVLTAANNRLYVCVVIERTA